MYKPYYIKLTFKGIKCRIKVDVKDQEIYGVLIEANKELTESDFNGLKTYLEHEGYIDEAYEHYSCKNYLTE